MICLFDVVLQFSGCLAIVRIVRDLIDASRVLMSMLFGAGLTFTSMSRDKVGRTSSISQDAGFNPSCKFSSTGLYDR